MSVEIVGYTGSTAIGLPGIGQTTTAFPVWAGALIGIIAGFVLTRKSVKSHPSLLIMGGLGLIGYIIAKDLQNQSLP